MKFKHITLKSFSWTMLSELLSLVNYIKKTKRGKPLCLCETNSICTDSEKKPYSQDHSEYKYVDVFLDWFGDNVCVQCHQFFFSLVEPIFMDGTGFAPYNTTCILGIQLNRKKQKSLIQRRDKTAVAHVRILFINTIVL